MSDIYDDEMPICSECGVEMVLDHRYPETLLPNYEIEVYKCPQCGKAVEVD